MAWSCGEWTWSCRAIVWTVAVGAFSHDNTNQVFYTHTGQLTATPVIERAAGRHPAGLKRTQAHRLTWSVLVRGSARCSAEGLKPCFFFFFFSNCETRQTSINNLS